MTPSFPAYVPPSLASADALALIDLIPAGICMVDVLGHFVGVNSSFAALVGYHRDALIGQHFSEIIHSDDLTVASDALAQLLDGRVSLFKSEKRYLHKDGTVFWVSLTSTLVRGTANEPLHVVTVVQEIEDRKRAETALRESEIRFRTLFEQAPFSVQRLSMEGRTLQVNTAWKTIWRIFDDEASKNYILNEYNILADPQLEAKGIASYIRAAYGGESVTIPPILYDPAEIGQSGRPRWVTAHAHPIKNESGTVCEVMLIHLDVTDQVEKEAELKSAKEIAENASRMKSTFLANMSHEIRTPLGAILGFTELLKGGRSSTGDTQRYLDIIERNGRSLTQIINDVLDLSQVESGNLKIVTSTIPIHDLIFEVVNLFGVEHKKLGLYLDVAFDSDAPEYIVSDAIRVKQILVNLIGNALKFTSQGGVRIRVTATTGGARCVIAVHDTGMGIPPESHHQLFQPFSQVDSTSTRRFAGTGLGLALSKRLAQLIGGDVVLLDSVPSTGSTFALELPACEEVARLDGEVDGVHHAAAPTQGKLEGMHILVVDDFADNRLLISRLLAQQGASFAIASDGQEAIAKAGLEQFNLILMDIQMPLMDGIEATRQLRLAGYDRPIIAVTADAMKDEAQRCLDAGCSDHLPKPIDSVKLIDAICRLA